VKLNDIQEEDILNEGLFRHLVTAVKYAVIALTGYIILRAIKNMIFSKKEEDESYYYVVFSSMIQVTERSAERKLEDVMAALTPHIAEQSGAVDSGYVVKKATGSEIRKITTDDGEPLDRVDGNVYAINMIFFYERSTDKVKAKQIIDRVIDRYDIDMVFESVKEGRT